MAYETQLDGATAVDVINASFGRHPRRRALHAKGIWCRGTFRATPEAAALSRAAHLQGGDVPVLARLSNGGGNPKCPDYAPDVRGLAVKFELPGGEADRPRLPKRSPLRLPHARGVPRSPESPDRPAAVVKLPLFFARHAALVAFAAREHESADADRRVRSVPLLQRPRLRLGYRGRHQDVRALRLAAREGSAADRAPRIPLARARLPVREPPGVPARSLDPRRPDRGSGR